MSNFRTSRSRTSERRSQLHSIRYGQAERVPSGPSRRRESGHFVSGSGVIASFGVTPTYYLVFAAMLFSIGAVGLLVRRNVLVMFMCVELMLNAVNVTFVAFSRALNDVSGQAIVFFVLVVAAAEVAVGLAIILAIFRRRRSGATADDIDLLQG